MLAALLVALVLAAGFVAWAVGAESGSRTLLGLVPGLRVEGARGSLLGDFSAEHVEVALEGRDRVVLEGLSWQGLQVQYDPALAWRVRLSAARVAARQVRVELPEPPKKHVPPVTLVLPFALVADRVDVGELVTPGLQDPTLTDITGQVVLGAQDGSLHTARQARARWHGMQLQGDGQITTRAPFDLRVTIEAARAGTPVPAADATGGTNGAAPTGVASLPWSGKLQAEGPLTAMALTARVQAKDQALNASATWTPWAEQPLPKLLADAQALNLQALHPKAPRTAISGTAEVRFADAPEAGGTASQDAAGKATVKPETSATSTPLKIQAELRNTLPLSLDQGGLPISTLHLRASSDPRHPERGTVDDALVQWADVQGPAGRVQAKGQWAMAGATDTAGRALDFTLDAEAQALRLRGLHRAAPALTLSGPVTLRAQALPLDAAVPGHAPSVGQVQVKAGLNGRWLDGTQLNAAATQPFELQTTLDSRWQRDAAGAWRLQGLDVEQAQLRAATGLASLRAKLLPEPTEGTPRDPAALRRWHLTTVGGLRDFDLRVLGIGGAEAARHTQQLSATTRIDLTAAAPRQPLAGFKTWMDWASTWRGDALLQVADSRIGDVPLQGSLQMQSASAAQWRTQAKLNAAGAQVQVDGMLESNPDGTGDRWTAQMDAPSLAALAPVAQALGLHLPEVAGRAKGKATLQGRWPQLQTQGELHADGLRWDALTAEQWHTTWQLGTRDNEPVALQAEMRELRWGAERVHALSATVAGTARSHTLQLRADRAARTPAPDTPANVTPPAWKQALVAQVQAQGKLQAEAQATQWQGTVRSVSLQPVDEQSRIGAPWLQAGPFEVQARLGDVSTLSVSPAQMSLFNAALQVNRLRWERATDRPAQLDLQADLVPMAVAPLLARAQPDFGWSGDLQLGGHINLRSTPTGVVADAEIARLGGDLVITDDTGTQRLGLEQLRMVVSARDGVWRATQDLSGRNLGTLQGEQTARTDPMALGPNAQSALSGQFKLRVDKLGSLGAWLPIGTVGAGWRLSGSVDSQAQLGGRLGAPLYTGELHGRGIGVRNGLEGVNVTDGQLDMVMDGEQARIERFTVRAGEGTVSLEGKARFGADPTATLQLTAERFALLQRVDRRVTLSGTGTVTLDREATRINGALAVDEGLFDISRRDAPSLSDDVDVLPTADAASAPGAAASSPSSVGSAAKKRRTLLDLRIAAGDKLRLRGRGLDTLLKGELRITSNAAGQPLVNGAIRAEDGTYAAYGQKLQLERGIIDFKGRVDNPRLDIVAIRPPPPGSDDSAVRVGVSIIGTAQDPRVRLTSEPEMSETDKMAYLVLGRTSDGLGRADLLVLQRAAVALLAEDGGGDPAQGFLGKLGIDELSVSQGDGQVRETIVKVGKQLSQRWYVGYERSLNATAGTWQVLYRIAQRFSVRAQSQQGESSSLDFIWTWRWE